MFRIELRYFEIASVWDIFELYLAIYFSLGLMRINHGSNNSIQTTSFTCNPEASQLLSSKLWELFWQSLQITVPQPAQVLVVSTKSQSGRYRYNLILHASSCGSNEAILPGPQVMEAVETMINTTSNIIIKGNWKDICLLSFITYCRIYKHQNLFFWSNFHTLPSFVIAACS